MFEMENLQKKPINLSFFTLFCEKKDFNEFELPPVQFESNPSCILKFELESQI